MTHAAKLSGARLVPRRWLFTLLGVGVRVRRRRSRVRGDLRLHPLIDGEAIIAVALLTLPLFFLVGIGCFDYWFYWAAGAPTRPEDHSGHGAHVVEGLLPRQHRPQGHRHPVHRHLVLLPLRRRPDGDADARRAGRAGRASSSTPTPSTASSASTRRC